MAGVAGRGPSGEIVHAGRSSASASRLTASSASASALALWVLLQGLHALKNARNARDLRR